MNLQATQHPNPSSGILTYSDDIEFKPEDVPHHYVMYNVPKSDVYNRFKQDMLLFNDVVTKVVGTSPFNNDGNKLYQIKCSEYPWQLKLKDGRHWQMNWGNPLLQW